MDTLETLAEHPASERLLEDHVERARFILWCDIQELLFGGKCGSMTDEQFSRILGVVLAWRQKRRSPPRCLACGSTAVSFFPDDETGLPHPSCDGRLRCVGWGFCEPKEEFAELYTAEGELLKKTRAHA
jgi:hypothetical protein